MMKDGNKVSRFLMKKQDTGERMDAAIKSWQSRSERNMVRFLSAW